MEHKYEHEQQAETVVEYGEDGDDSTCDGCDRYILPREAQRAGVLTICRDCACKWGIA